jgi:hypothetical protein
VCGKLPEKLMMKNQNKNWPVPVMKSSFFPCTSLAIGLLCAAARRISDDVVFGVAYGKAGRVVVVFNGFGIKHCVQNRLFRDFNKLFSLNYV